MIDETRTLKALLRDVLQLKDTVELAHDISGSAEMSAVLCALRLILDQYRDRPIRCEDGGKTPLVGGTGWQLPTNITIAPRRSDEEVEAEQEDAWRKLFEL